LANTEELFSSVFTIFNYDFAHTHTLMPD